MENARMVGMDDSLVGGTEVGRSPTGASTAFARPSQIGEAVLGRLSRLPGGKQRGFCNTLPLGDMELARRVEVASAFLQKTCGQAPRRRLIATVADCRKKDPRATASFCRRGPTAPACSAAIHPREDSGLARSQSLFLNHAERRVASPSPAKPFRTSERILLKTGQALCYTYAYARPSGVVTSRLTSNGPLGLDFRARP